MEQMLFLYTALGVFDKTYYKDGRGWEDYVEWSKLTHATEIVSLDGMLNELLVEHDYSDDDWKFIHCAGKWQTDFFTSQEYVLRKCNKNNNFNLLTVVISPLRECQYITVDGYEFMGYELLDHEFGVSVLTNCNGFNEAFLPTDLNEYGLVDDYLAAYDIKKRLLENNPQHAHAKTNVIAVWRHKTIGRTKPNPYYLL